MKNQILYFPNSEFAKIANSYTIIFISISIFYTMFLRLFRYAFTNITRNAFLSFSSILVLTLLIFFINILLLVHDVSVRIIDTINERLTISLYLKEGYGRDSADVIDLIGDIKKDLPNIRSEYKTKEDIINDIREQDPELVSILERQNPLPETITLTNIYLNQFESLNYIIEGKNYILSESEDDQLTFSSYTSQYQRIVQITVVIQVLQIGLYIIIGIFLFSIGVIIYSIIGNFIYYFRDEIYITRLVWGSKVFIYGPFSLQGAIYASIACIFSMILFFLFIQGIEVLFDTHLLQSGLLSGIFLILLIELCVSIFIWGISWFVSSRKYLK